MDQSTTLSDPVDPLAVMFAPPEEPNREPLRTRTGPRLSKAEKKAARRERRNDAARAILQLAMTRLRIGELLQQGAGLSWTFHPAGALLLALGDGEVLQVHAPSLRQPGLPDALSHSVVSTGYLVSGRLGVTYYREQSRGEICLAQSWRSDTGPIGGPVRVSLASGEERILAPGDAFRIAAGEITRQTPGEGAVLIVASQADRFVSGRLFYPLGSELGDNRMSPATPEQIATVLAAALEAWSAH